LCREHLDIRKSTPVYGVSSSSGSDEKEEEEERVELNEVGEGGSTEGPCSGYGMVTTDSCGTCHEFVHDFY
jgi:hypothetical protein